MKVKTINTNNENKTHMCNCKEVEKKLISLLKDNGKLLQMIRDLRKENERLSGELGRRRLLEEEEKELKKRIDDLEKCQGPLESEITRLAAYKEDFERERRDREKIHEEKEKLKRELESAEEIIKMLTTQFDVVCREIRALEERPALPVQVRHQRQLVQPFAMGMDSL